MISLYGKGAREFGGIWGEFVNGRGRLGADDVGVVAGVVGVGFTFAGEGMEGNGLVRNVVHGEKGGAGGREGRPRGKSI
jgi:hypothetical protein